MECEEYLGKSRLFQHLRSGPHGRLVERYAARLVEDDLVRLGTWRCLNVVSGLLSWIASRRWTHGADLDERRVEQYLLHRAEKQSIQPGDRAALKRWLSVLREERAIAPAVLPPLTPHNRIFQEFDAYLRTERGLAPKSIVRHLPVIRRFLHEVCPAGDDDLGKISQEKVIGYIERHAQDWSPVTGKAMCWSLRAFLRYLHHQGLNPHALADCVPSMRRWKLASLPTFLSVAQVQKGTRWLRPGNPCGTAGLRHFDDAGQTRPAGQRGRDAHPRRYRLACQRDARSRQGPTARTDADPSGRWHGHSWISAQWPPKVVVSALVPPRARTLCRLCFRVCDHDDRQDRS